MCIISVCFLQQTILTSQDFKDFRSAVIKYEILQFVHELMPHSITFGLWESTTKVIMVKLNCAWPHELWLEVFSLLLGGVTSHRSNTK